MLHKRKQSNQCKAESLFYPKPLNYSHILHISVAAVQHLVLFAHSCFGPSFVLSLDKKKQKNKTQGRGQNVTAMQPEAVIIIMLLPHLDWCVYRTFNRAKMANLVNVIQWIVRNLLRDMLNFKSILIMVKENQIFH